jgi:membrane-bound metal-dependent hydrolase YbcI (DUF457 family)
MAFAFGVGGLLGLGQYEWVALTVGAYFPDRMDAMLAGGEKEAWDNVHRTLSHWPVFFPAVLALFVFSEANIPPVVFRPIYWFLVGGLIHVSMDFLTHSGIPLYPPFRFQDRVSLHLMSAKSIAAYLFGFVPLIAYLIVLAFI